MTLREKIEALPDAVTAGGRKIEGARDLAAVLRIVAEHEQQTAPPVGQAGGDSIVDRFVGCIPRLQVAAEAGKADAKAGRARVTGDRCLRASKQGDWNAAYDRAYDATLAEVQQMARQQEPAEVPRWRKELERLRATIGQEPDPLSMADHRRLAALLDLAILADVIASGRGQAVVPKGVAQYMPIEGGGHHPAGIWEPWSDRGDWALRDRRNGLYTADKEYILTAINAYGDSLCGAP